MTAKTHSVVGVGVVAFGAFGNTTLLIRNEQVFDHTLNTIVCSCTIAELTRSMTVITGMSIRFVEIVHCLAFSAVGIGGSSAIYTRYMAVKTLLVGCATI